jgi:rare lipoprotein A
MRGLFYILFLLGLFATLELQAQQIGYASFYSDYFHGRKTASGQLFDNRKLTCAHRTLPFGTMLKVINLENDKSIIVRVTDRGPYAKGRVIDLTKEGARQLDFIKKGIAKVRIEVQNHLEDVFEDMDVTSDIDTIFTGSSSPGDIQPLEIIVDSVFFQRYGIKVFTFDNADRANEEAKKLERLYQFSVQVIEVQMQKGMLYRVCVGNFETRDDAQKAADIIKVKYPKSFVFQYSKD